MKYTDEDILLYFHNLRIPNRYLVEIFDREGSYLDFFLKGDSYLRKIDYIDPKIKNKFRFDFQEVSIVKNLYEKNSIKYITILSSNFPEKLKLIEDPPLVIYYKGYLKVKNLIAIVGARKASSYGKWVCQEFTKELVKAGFSIVSGLALGIDSIAHRECIKMGGYTIGVLGNSLEIVYPKRNRELYDSMFRDHCVISEYPLNTQPLAYNFPRRNRIISALSDGVIVVEAEEKSGSLITARYGAEQGKEVFAVPGNINNLLSRGTNRLIRDGAIPLLEINDILDFYPDLRLKEENKQLKMIEYSIEEEEIIKNIKISPKSSEELSIILDKNISEVNILLTKMELKGYIREISKNIFTIA